mmetsp:Transcript_13699/g.38557  ORF Transcript_13699/g.38557 Transcript_13699/m.38557 type:complete len:253 (+) Transcript_13699:3900-4658(+)
MHKYHNLRLLSKCPGFRNHNLLAYVSSFRTKFLLSTPPRMELCSRRCFRHTDTTHSNAGQAATARKREGQLLPYCRMEASIYLSSGSDRNPWSLSMMIEQRILTCFHLGRCGILLLSTGPALVQLQPKSVSSSAIRFPLRAGDVHNGLLHPPLPRRRPIQRVLSCLGPPDICVRSSHYLSIDDNGNMKNMPLKTLRSRKGSSFEKNHSNELRCSEPVRHRQVFGSDHSRKNLHRDSFCLNPMGKWSLSPLLP